MATNPYATPTARVDDTKPRQTGRDFLPDGAKVPAGHGWRWIKTGMRLFAAQPWTWIVLVVLLLAAAFVLAIIPFVGMIALMLLTPVVLAGLLAGCNAIDTGEGLRVKHAFAGFGEHTGRLMLLGLLQLLATIGMFAIVFAASGFDFEGVTEELQAGRMSASFALIAVVYLTLGMLYMMAIWFAPALIYFAGESVGTSLKKSFAATAKNWLPFTVYSAVAFVAWLVLAALFGGVIGATAAMIGLAALFIVGPIVGIVVVISTAILIASGYASYRDIFHQRA